MFLTKETRDTFLKNMDPDEIIDDLMDNYKSFSIEMHQNRQIFMRSSVLYELTVHDSITI